MGTAREELEDADVQCKNDRNEAGTFKNRKR